MWSVHQLQELRRVGEWCFYNNGWWYKKNLRVCFYQDINVPNNFLVMAHWMIGEEQVAQSFNIEIDRPICGYNHVCEHDMELALKQAESKVKSYCKEV